MSQENNLNRSSLNQRLPQIVYAVIALLAVLVAQFSGLFAAPPTASANLPLTVASADAHLTWLGRLFAYPPPPLIATSDPAGHIECSDVYPQACAPGASADLRLHFNNFYLFRFHRNCN